MAVVKIMVSAINVQTLDDTPHTHFPKEINFDDQRIMVDNFRTAADHSGLKKCENSAIIGNCQISVKEVQSSLSIFAQKYLHKCEDTYFILQNKYIHIYEDSFRAKILRDDCTLYLTLLLPPTNTPKCPI